MTKKEQLKIEYQKQRHRIFSAISKIRKSGLVVVTPEILPSIPKRITEASIRRLSQITPANIRRKSYIPDAETGELTKYGKTSVYKQRSSKDVEEVSPLAEASIFNIRTHILMNFSSELANFLIGILDYEIQHKGAEVVERRMNNASSGLVERAYRTFSPSGSEEMQASAVSILELIAGHVSTAERKEIERLAWEAVTNYRKYRRRG